MAIIMVADCYAVEVINEVYPNFKGLEMAKWNGLWLVITKLHLALRLSHF